MALWDARLAAWFPEGLADPRLALLRVDLDHGEYWDEHASRMVGWFARARRAAVAAGTAPPPGEHHRLYAPKSPHRDATRRLKRPGEAAT